MHSCSKPLGFDVVSYTAKVNWLRSRMMKTTNNKTSGTEFGESCWVEVGAKGRKIMSNLLVEAGWISHIQSWRNGGPCYVEAKQLGKCVLWKPAWKKMYLRNWGPCQLMFCKNAHSVHWLLSALYNKIQEEWDGLKKTFFSWHMGFWGNIE